jgi:hypothetical protein
MQSLAETEPVSRRFNACLLTTNPEILLECMLREVRLPLWVERVGVPGQSEGERYLITLTTCTNQSLIGTQQVDWLVLTAVTNRPSAFVLVEIGPSIGTQPDGTFTANYVTQTGTVVVVGEEQLLESTRSTNGFVQLILYSKTGVTNRVQTTSSLPVPGPWTEWQQIVSSNILQNLTPLHPTNREMVFRAVRS